MRISKLFIDRQVVDHPVTQSIQARLDVPAIISQSARQVHEMVASAPDPVQSAKEILYLSRNQGAFLNAARAQAIIPAAITASCTSALFVIWIVPIVFCRPIFIRPS
jgi:hypothetical protein